MLLKHPYVIGEMNKHNQQNYQCLFTNTPYMHGGYHTNKHRQQRFPVIVGTAPMVPWKLNHKHKVCMHVLQSS